MSIGNSLDMQQMLKESLSVITRRLGCSVTTLLHQKPGDKSFEPVITIPLRASDNPQLNNVKSRAIELINSGVPLPCPLNDQHTDLLHYGWRINHNGLLIIGRSSPLSTPLIKELNPLIEKLGLAVTACLQFSHLTQARNELKYERTLLNNLVSNLGVGILVEDDEGNVCHINKSFIDLFELHDKTQSIYTQRKLQLNLIADHFKFPDDFRRQTYHDFKCKTISLNREFELSNGRTYLRDYTSFEIKNDVQAHLWQYRDITSSKLAEEHLRESRIRMEYLAHHDALTNLPNRNQLESLVQKATLRADRYETLVAICFLDLDNFKQINDQYGHHIGDKLLIEAGEILCGIIRGTDSVARLGGDEFVVLLGDISNSNELELALKRILNAVNSPIEIEHLTLSITASIGVTIYPFDRGDTDTLIRHADQAMYKVKQSGRNQYHLFDINKDIEKGKHQREIDRLWQALKNDEFVLYYQPKVNMRSGAVIGAEALIRWINPEKGLLSPSDFLPSIESNSKLNNAVGNWVILNALTQIQKWEAKGINLNISINISATQLQAKGFIKSIEQIIYNFPEELSNRIEFEILETASIDNPELMKIILQECERLGVRSSLDDFGTGYSSLAYLKQLPVHTIKIDQTFVRDLLHDQDDYAIVDGIIRLASAFNKEIIAEGVETAEHGIILMRLGCDNAQGYFISKPIPAEEFARWVRNYQLPDAWKDIDS
ncbi:MAG: EAL domain-containing protein [Sedimenticola sp.]